MSAFQPVSTSAFQRVSLRGKERTPVVRALPRCGCLRNRRTLDLSYSVVSLPGVGQGCTTERAGCGTLPMAGSLCIARALANEPEVLLMDEPCSALDPIATERIEELIVELKRDYTIVIVTHN